MGSGTYDTYFHYCTDGITILIAVALTIAILLTSSKGNPLDVGITPELLPLQWSNNCPKSASSCPPSFEGIPPLLLVSVDGFRADYLDRGLTPTIEKLSLCGVRTPYMQPVFPTKTFPNHFSQVTGLYPAWHGIVDNFMNDTETRKIFKLGKSSILEPFWWEAEPIWVSAVKQGKKAATYFWPGSDVKINGTRPTYYKNYSSSVPFEERVDQVHRWLDYPPSDRPSVITLYFNEPDSSAHSHGVYSKEVDEALVKVDRAIERLFAGLQMRNLTDCINVFITSDHGMTDISCSRSINIGKFVDVSTVRNTEGPMGRLQVLEEANTSLEAVLQELRCRDEHMRVYFREQLPVRAHYSNHRRIEPIFIDVDSGWNLLRREPKVGEWKCSGGMHGYDNLWPDMRAFFTAIGPSLKRNFSAEPFINTELYELMCELIDIVPNPNNGTKGGLHHLLKAPGQPLEEEETLRIPTRGFAMHDPSAAECPCNPVPNTQLNTSTPLGLHLPFGVPDSTTENDHLLLLQNSDYVLAYNTLQRMAAWVAFTLPSQANFSDSNNICWAGDPRVPTDKTAKCTDYDSLFFKEKSILQGSLYPIGFSGALTQAESMFVTNSIPKSVNHTVLEAKMIDILSRWSVEEGPVHVLTGPAFDLLATGIKPSPHDFENANRGPLLIPTHMFLVITWCLDKKADLQDCDPHRLRANAFLLPNWPFSVNCEIPEKIIKENEARVVDVEKLTGFSLYKALHVYEVVRLRTSLPNDYWKTFA
ncbi:Ectonucleotide like protein [Argiope bruennichi]|uniref:Ectonucleotide like protein n=1 Tax=Argiope bruennichi TaxID=94029 RepID=A0A8T0EAQ4_ARGBR|nr:Ectonucleotide like protein [Argiope bruennichi]